MLLTTTNLTKLYTGFKSTFANAFAAAPTDWEKVAMEVPSATEQETYGWLGSTTRFREWLGERVIQNLKTHDYTIKNKDFENTVGVERGKIQDDTYGVYQPFVGQLGQDAKTHPDELVFAMLKQGFSTPCYDKQYFFDTDHPVIGADGSPTFVSNSGGGTGEPWFLFDTSKIVKPLIFQKRQDYNFVRMDDPTDESVFSRKLFRYGVDARVNVGFGLWQMVYGSRQPLTPEAYGAARTALMSMKGDNGKPLNVRPNLVVCGPSFETAALQILTAERDSMGASNIYRDTAKLLVTPWLA